MNRHPDNRRYQLSPQSVRLWALIGVLVAVSQLNDALAGATIMQQVLFWGGRVMTMTVSLFAAQRLVDRWCAERWAWPAWLKPVVVVSALALLPFAAVELWLEMRLPTVPDQDDQVLWGQSPLLAYVTEYATLATVVLPLHFLVWWLVEARTADAPAAPAPSPVASPDFLRLSQGLNIDDVAALKAEEHYVRVISPRGDELLLYKFGDALSEMPDAIGLQVHRSWWVADKHVTGSRRGERRWQLLVGEGLAVPVSDRFVKAVRARGHLKRRPRRSAGQTPG